MPSLRSALALCATVAAAPLLARGAPFGDLPREEPLPLARGALPQDGAKGEGPQEKGGLDALGRQLRGEGPWTPALGPAAPSEPYRAPVVSADPGRSGAWRTQLQLGTQHAASAELGSAEGRLETRRLGADIRALRGDRDEGALVDVGIEVSEYRFRGATGLLFNTDSPTEDVVGIGAGAGWRGRVSERWEWLAGVSVRAAGEVDADFGDALTYAVLGTATYRPQARIGWTFGALALTQLEDSAQVIPVIGVDWRIDARTQIATRGPKIELSRELDGGFRAYASVEYQSRQYRLDDSGPLPEGVMRDRAFAGLVGLDWDPRFGSEEPTSKRLSIFVGSNLWREIAFLENDRTVARSRLHPGMLIGISLRFGL